MVLDNVYKPVFTSISSGSRFTLGLQSQYLLRAFVITALLTAFATGANAFSPNPGLESIKRVATESDAVITGEVVSVDWKVSRTGNTFTIYTIQNVSVLTSTGPLRLDQDIQLYQWGGIIENTDMNVKEPYIHSFFAGSPALVATDRIVAFVKDNGQSLVPFINGSDGVLFTIDNEVLTNYNSEILYFFEQTGEHDPNYDPPGVTTISSPDEGPVEVGIAEQSAMSLDDLTKYLGEKHLPATELEIQKSIELLAPLELDKSFIE